jgi:hypothetical protein
MEFVFVFINIIIIITFQRVARLRKWLRRYVTDRKVAGSSNDRLINLFQFT